MEYNFEVLSYAFLREVKLNQMKYNSDVFGTLGIIDLIHNISCSLKIRYFADRVLINYNK